MTNRTLRLIRWVGWQQMVSPAPKLAVVEYTPRLQSDYEPVVALKEHAAWFHDDIRLRSHRLTNAKGEAQ